MEYGQTIGSHWWGKQGGNHSKIPANGGKGQSRSK